MRSKTSLLAIAVLTAVLLAIGGILPAMAAATGAVTVNKSYVSPTGTVTVTVTDADLDTLTAVKQDVTFTGNGDSASQNVTLTLGTGESISGTPVVLDNNGTNTKADGTTATANTTDVTESTNFNVSVFNASTGTVTITAFADVDGKNGDGNATADTVSYPITVSYNKAVAQTTTAKVTSTQDSTGVTITLTEDAASSGKFVGTFTVGASASSGSTIQAVAGHVITISYTDANPVGTRTASVTVEATEPVITVVSPANNAFETSVTPKLTVDITDPDSGVSTTAGDIVFTLATTTVDSGTAPTITGNATITTTAITNGLRAEVTLAGFAADRTTKVTWRVTAKDKAGNEGQTDSNATTTGDQDHAIIVDRMAPAFASATAYAGRWWDASKAATVTDKTETDATKSSNTTIAVVFADILSATDESLDAATVSTTDFEIDSLKKADGTTVNDQTPTAVSVESGAKNTVFLTVPAMASDAKPKIILKAGISDTAGNTVSTGTITAAVDAQAPVITVTSDASQLTKTTAKVTFTTDETATPTAMVNATAVSGTTPTGGTSVTPTLVGTNSYSLTMSTAGVNSVHITATDGVNARMLGELFSATGFPSSKAIVVYVDTATPNPTVTPAASSSTETAEPFFITIDFTDEGKEYGISSSALTTTVADVKTGTDLDKDNAVTLNKLTLKQTATGTAVDVLADATTTDNVVHTLAVSGIATGTHTLVVNGTDTAGNKMAADLSVSFTVTARSAYSVALIAGWNLVSLPGDPTDGAIASVLSSARITQVLTYDAADANGPWLVATRGTDGTWSSASTISTIDSSHAYWINTTGGETVKSLLNLVAVGSGESLPTVKVAAGWNLLPVIDLRQRTSGTSIPVNDYLTSISWKVAYTYDPADTTYGPWVRILPGNTTHVKTGKGYWVWATAAGTLVP